MYLSRIAIDVKKYESMKAVYNIAKLHGMVERSFQGDRQRKLWRLDRMSGGDYVILLSPIPPQTDVLPNQIGFIDSTWETKNYDGLLSRIVKDSKWHFRVTANPTTAVLKEGSKRGKVKAITIYPQQREWIKRQGDRKGFLLKDAQFDVVESEWRMFKKENKETQILAVTFEGLLTVTDEMLFRNTLTSGIGREKAYGMGLLTVVPYVGY